MVFGGLGEMFGGGGSLFGSKIPNALDDYTGLSGVKDHGPGSFGNYVQNTLLKPLHKKSEAGLYGALGAIKEMPGVVNEGADKMSGLAAGLGQAAYQRATDREKQGLGGLSQNLVSSGLSGSTVGGNMQRGIQADTDRQLGQVDEAVAQQQQGIEAMRTEGLMQAQQARAAGLGALADYWNGRASQRFGQDVALWKLVQGAGAQADAVKQDTAAFGAENFWKPAEIAASVFGSYQLGKSGK